MEDFTSPKPPAAAAAASFGSDEYLERKKVFMQTYGATFPSEYWKEVIGLAFDDHWRGNKRDWAKPKGVPTPIDFTYEGVQLGEATFALDEMLEAKEKFIRSHEGALLSGRWPSVHWQRVLTVTFDEVWKGERLDDWRHLEYTPCDVMIRIRKMWLKAGGGECGYPGCCNPQYKGDVP
jgi:hypothetical protein